VEGALGSMMVLGKCDCRVTNTMAHAASDRCGNRLVLAHGGGYAET
jgi:hypothetical protein